MGDSGWDDAMTADMGGPVALVSDEPQPIQERKINRKRLGELDEHRKKKYVEFWIKDYKTGANKQVCVIDLDAAILCCDAVFKKKAATEKNEEKFKKYDLRYFDHDMTKAYKYVLNWVDKCGSDRDVVQINDVEDILNDDDPWQFLLDILVAAEKLEIPKASFSNFILKKAKGSFKTTLPDLDLVERFYDAEDGVPELRALAAYVIFEAWYDWTLEAEEHDNYMARLQKMREDKSALDDDINALIQDKDEFITRKREERKLKLQEDASNNASFDNNDGGLNTGFDGSNDVLATREGGDWDASGDAVDSAVGGGWDSNTDGAFGDAETPAWAQDTNDASNNSTPAAAGDNW